VEIRDKLDQANVTGHVLFPGFDGVSPAGTGTPPQKRKSLAETGSVSSVTCLLSRPLASPLL